MTIENNQFEELELIIDEAFNNHDLEYLSQDVKNKIISILKSAKPGDSIEITINKDYVSYLVLKSLVSEKIAFFQQDILRAIIYLLKTNNEETREDLDLALVEKNN